MDKFETKIGVRWSDCDANNHVRHSAYYDYGAHMRIHFFKEVGFDTKKLRSFNIGPILFKEECTFIKELSLDDEVIINIQKGKMSENGAKWQLHHEIFNANGEKCAHISISGAWMDLTARKLTIPPAALIERMKQLESGMDYVHVRKKKT